MTHTRSTLDVGACCGVPNKPMVPTAPTSLIEHAPGSLRRHIGRPLGGLAVGHRNEAIPRLPLQRLEA